MAVETMELPGTRSLEEQLRPLCGLNTPDVMRMVVSESSMAVACDGTMAMALVGEAGSEPLRVDVRDGLTRMLEVVPPNADSPLAERIETTVEKLLAWTGPPVWKFPCDTCNGTGKTEAMVHCAKCDGSGSIDCYCSDCDHAHERECPECDGDGDIVGKDGETMTCDDCHGSCTLSELPAPDDDDPGIIFSMVLDRRRLARLLATSPGGACVVWVHHAGNTPEQQRLHLRGFGWRALLMGMRRELDGLGRFDPSL